MTQALKVSRRSFIKASSAVSAGGLLMGVSIASGPARAAGMMYTPNAWVHIADDNTITLISARSEMGQGVYTSMPMLIAEELNVELNRVKVAIAPPNAKLYGNEVLGGAQITGGSASVRDGWEKLRVAGAQVREMLISAAATKWNVDRSTLKAENGMVIGEGKGKRATYGQLAEAASKLPVPQKVTLKDPGQFRVVGKRITRLDTPSKCNGTATFGIDVKLPGMVYASLEQCPVISGTVKSFDASAAKGMPGVIDVVQIPDGVAVVADTYWHALKARRALKVEWDEGPNANLNTAAMLAGTKAAAGSGKPLATKIVGDADAAINAPVAKVIRAEYVCPNLSHSPMEPMNFTAWYRGNKMDLIGPTQFQQGAQGTIAQAVGLDPDAVSLQTTFLGGGFGRRLDVDFIVQAAQISKAVMKPVKLLWTREDDMTHDFYRPMGVHNVAAAVDNGKPTAMTFRFTSQSITGRFGGLPAEVQDPFMIEAAVAPYDVAAIRHDAVKHDAGLRVGFWRSVSHFQNCFANETFIDELAAAAKVDPVAYRMSLIGKASPRFQNVLKLAADKSGWGTPAPAGRSRGVALMEGYDTYMAMVTEISMKDGAPVVHKVTVASDCGHMVNPDTVEAQIQSSIIFGLSAVLWDEITVEKGRVQQTNFDKYRVMRNNEAPQIDLVIVRSTEKPGGIGEPATAMIGPAVGNAIFAATGKRVRRMPFTAENIASA